MNLLPPDPHSPRQLRLRSELDILTLHTESHDEMMNGLTNIYGHTIGSSRDLKGLEATLADTDHSVDQITHATFNAVGSQFVVMHTLSVEFMEDNDKKVVEHVRQLTNEDTLYEAVVRNLKAPRYAEVLHPVNIACEVFIWNKVQREAMTLGVDHPNVTKLIQLGSYPESRLAMNVALDNLIYTSTKEAAEIVGVESSTVADLLDAAYSEKSAKAMKAGLDNVLWKQLKFAKSTNNLRDEHLLLGHASIPEAKRAFSKFLRPTALPNTVPENTFESIILNTWKDFDPKKFKKYE